jgi:hypothetical protein
MEWISVEQVVTVINRALPYSNQIEDWDLSKPNVIRFTWRGSRFRVGNGIYVEECTPTGFLLGSVSAIMLQELLRQNWIANPPDPPKVRVRREVKVFATEPSFMISGHEMRSVLAPLPPDATNIKVSFDTAEEK